MDKVLIAIGYILTTCVGFYIYGKVQERKEEKPKEKKIKPKYEDYDYDDSSYDPDPWMDRYN